MKRYKFSERSPEYYLTEEVDALIAEKDEEIDELISILKRLVTISDRKHDDWDKAKELIAKQEGDKNVFRK